MSLAESRLAPLGRSLAPLFGGASPTFLTDSELVVNALREAGHEANHFSTLETQMTPGLPAGALNNVVMLPIHYRRTPPGAIIEAALGGAALLAVPVASFCRSERGALYFLERLASVNFEKCIDSVAEWLDVIAMADSIRMVDGQTDITVSLSDDVYLMGPKTSQLIHRGEWASIAQYLELGLVSYRAATVPHHQMEGRLAADGVCISYHRYAPDYVEDIVDDAWKYLMNVKIRNGDAPIIVTIDGSKMVDATCGDDRIYNDLMRFANKSSHPYVGEFAFSTLSLEDSSQINWSINSQFNEAVGGMHIGIGNGVDGAHIDFVASRAVRV